MINKKKIVFKYFINNLVTIIILALTAVFYQNINIGWEKISKLGFCLVLPLINILQSLLFILFSYVEYKNNHIKNSGTFYSLNKYICLICNFGQCLILLSILNVNISLITIYLEMLGLCVLTLGNYFPKLKESKIIKSISFNVNKDVNKWHTFTRVSGFAYLFVGLFIIILGTLNDYIAIFISLGLIIITGIVLQLYSIALGKR